MSIISSIARDDPGLIENSIVAENNGDYLVKFQSNGQEVDQQVDDMFPVNANGQTVFAGIAADGALWPSILEKAWCYFRPMTTLANSYDGIQSGLPSESLKAFGSTDATDGGTTSFTTANQILSTLSGYLQAGDLADVGTLDSQNLPEPLASGLFKGHAYSVVQVNPGANTIELRNPWATNTDGSIDGTGGYITISGDQLLQSIDLVSHGTVPGATPNPVIVVNPTPTPTPTPTTTTTTQTVPGQLGPNSYQATDGTNYDVYTFTANSDGQADISVTSTDFTPELLIAQVGTDGTPTAIGSDANDAAGNVADVKFTVTTGVTYEIGVFTGSNNTGSYTLTLNGDLSTPVQSTPATATGSLTGVVYNDTNADGAKDNGEVGLQGFTVFIDLYDTGQFENGDPTATTDQNGAYTFTNLTPGTYSVFVEPSQRLWSQTSPASNAASVTGTVAAGQNTVVSPIGEAQASSGSLTGNVYSDTNANSVQDSGEAGPWRDGMSTSMSTTPVHM